MSFTSLSDRGTDMRLHVKLNARLIEGAGHCDQIITGVYLSPRVSRVDEVKRAPRASLRDICLLTCMCKPYGDNVIDRIMHFTYIVKAVNVNGSDYKP